MFKYKFIKIRIISIQIFEYITLIIRRNWPACLLIYNYFRISRSQLLIIIINIIFIKPCDVV